MLPLVNLAASVSSPSPPPSWQRLPWTPRHLKSVGLRWVKFSIAQLGGFFQSYYLTANLFFDINWIKELEGYFFVCLLLVRLDYVKLGARALAVLWQRRKIQPPLPPQSLIYDNILTNVMIGLKYDAMLKNKHLIEKTKARTRTLCSLVSYINAHLNLILRCNLSEPLQTKYVTSRPM